MFTVQQEMQLCNKMTEVPQKCIMNILLLLPKATLTYSVLSSMWWVVWEPVWLLLWNVTNTTIQLSATWTLFHIFSENNLI